MDILTNYINDTFSAMPKTEEMMDIKSKILIKIEKRYDLLKNEGKSENEIIKILMSEFSNMDELINKNINENINTKSVENNYVISDDIIPDDDSLNPYNNSKVVKAIISIYWPFIILFYLYISFTFGNWFVSWIILILAVILKNFFCTYFDIKTQ